ncbi:aldehyde dehydrogenase [Nocardia sp. CA2R105]|uniref:aldehyde dehydrogenase n=1 Tax=Nocardia coffeae TaxID=2873381 RepID=UPI001CA62F68|nr:aldehyde dehydrogenase [Nocardia coffeae]MBY8858690.1 aldehyde dehydrogenase [Nocardia coffeae]
MLSNVTQLLAVPYAVSQILYGLILIIVVTPPTQSRSDVRSRCDRADKPKQDDNGSDVTTIHTTTQVTENVREFGIWIANEEVTPRGSARLTVLDPTSGKPWSSLVDADVAAVGRAVAAATAAARGRWRASPSERAAALHRLADLVAENAEALARLDVRDNGKILRETINQIGSTARWYRFYAGLADKIHGATLDSDSPSAFNFTLREPLGVIACITAWNSPLLMAALKIAPALAAGNTVVLKPSEFASSSTLALARLWAEAGLPSGVLNVVTGGSVAGSALVEHPDVAHVSFTGSPGTGSRVAAAASARFKGVTLELGGKSANIVFDDADLDAAVVGALGGIFSAAGQSCVAGSRVLVHRAVHDEVLERLRARAAAIVVGDPAQESTEMGPIANAPQLAKVEHYVAVGHEDGARLVTGGERVGDGFWFRPTIFADVAADSRLAQEEVFGPVLAVISFDAEEEAVAIANSTRYGLAAGVWTADLARAHRVIRALEAGTVFVNTYRAMAPNMPGGGVKDSGIGREGGIEAVLDFTQVKAVFVENEPTAVDPFRMRF